MLRFTLDTNTLVSATISEGKEYKLLKLAKDGKIKLFLSLEIIKEFEEVISREKFGFSHEQVEDAVKQLLNISEIVVPKEKLDVIKDDPDDNIILECATSGKVEYIVSGDSHVLSLKEYAGIKIIRTDEALKKVNFT